jgi:phage baseplate assembly protein V
MTPRIKAELERIRGKVRSIASRAVIKLVKDGLKTQSVQLNILAGETTPDDTERFQQYGFTSVPLEGAEAIVLHLGGGRDHGVVIATEDRRYRLTGLADGEVALYDDQDQKIHIKRDRIVIEGTAIELGDGATKEVARKGDAIIIDGTTDSAFDLWKGQVEVAIVAIAALLNVAGPVIGAPGTVVPVAPFQAGATVTGKVNAGSAVVKAVD